MLPPATAGGVQPDDDFLTTERTSAGDADVLRVTLDRPEKLNALPLASLEALTAVAAGIEVDDVDALVLRGRGGDFCAGVDLTDVPGGESVTEGGRVMHDLVEALRSCPVPVLTAVEGRAFGAGFMLCLGADVVLAAEGASLGLQEVDLGIPIAGYVTTILPRSVGEHRARDWLLTGREVPAVEAERAGLVSRVVPAGDLGRAIADVLATLATSSPDAVALLKDRLAAPTGAPGERDEWDRLAERELADMRTAARDGDLDDRLASFRD